MCSNCSYLQLKLWSSCCLLFRTEIKSPDSDTEMLQELGINFVKGAQKDGNFLEKSLYRGLGKVEHIKKKNWREPSELSSPAQWISNEWNREPETNDCRKQSIVPAVSQSNEAQASSLLQNGQTGIYIRKREIQVKEKHRWTEEIRERRWWISNVFGERGIKQGWGMCKIQASGHCWWFRLEGTLRTDKHNKW